jgi:hypothetical protein
MKMEPIPYKGHKYGVTYDDVTLQQLRSAAQGNLPQSQISRSGLPYHVVAGLGKKVGCELLLITEDFNNIPLMLLVDLAESWLANGEPRFDMLDRQVMLHGHLYYGRIVEVDIAPEVLRQEYPYFVLSEHAFELQEYKVAQLVLARTLEELVDESKFRSLPTHVTSIRDALFNGMGDSCKEPLPPDEPEKN